jgi:antitoxin HicB
MKRSRTKTQAKRSSAFQRIKTGRENAIAHAEGRKQSSAGKKPNQYTVSDGKLVLLLEEAEEGGYIVGSPLDSELITEADSITEAFENARDALKALQTSRKKLIL